MHHFSQVMEVSTITLVTEMALVVGPQSDPDNALGKPKCQSGPQISSHIKVIQTETLRRCSGGQELRRHRDSTRAEGSRC